MAGDTTGSTITNATGGSQYGSNPNDTIQAAPPGMSVTDPNYQSLLNNNLAWFQNNPSLLSRYMLGKSGSGMQGNVYGNDPYSQFLQNRALAASTLAEYVNPAGAAGAGGSGGMSNFLPGAQSYMSNLGNLGSVLAAINAFAPDVQAMGGNSAAFQKAFLPGGGANGTAGSQAGSNWANALSAWNLTDPTEVSKLFQAAAAGLPSPLANAANGLISHLYQMYQDLSPQLSGQQFMPWLSQYF